MKTIDFVSIPEERMRLLNRTSCKRDLKEFLDVDIEINDDIEIKGEALQVNRAKEILRAFGRGFLFKECLDLLDEDYLLDMVNINEFSGKAKERLMTLRGRIIGKNGITKKAIEKAVNVKMCVYGKTVSLIGKWENLKKAREAVEMLLAGSKHTTVYRFLNENKIL